MYTVLYCSEYAYLCFPTFRHPDPLGSWVPLHLGASIPIQPKLRLHRRPRVLDHRHGACSGVSLWPGAVSWSCITSYQWIYSMITTGFALTILPQEAERLHSAAGTEDRKRPPGRPNSTGHHRKGVGPGA